MKTLIRNAQVVLPEETLRTNVLIDGGKIAAIDPAPHVAAETTVSAEGLYLLPGVIDDQVHFREPGATHKEDLASASRACAKGGVTTFLEMPNTRPATITQQALEEKLALAAGKSIVNFGFYIGATPDNIAELRAARRTPGIKIFVGSSTGNLLVDDQAALERIFAETTLPICVHCEDEATIRANAERIGPTDDPVDHSCIRDRRAALIATERILDLARRHRHPTHILHVSTIDEVEAVHRAGLGDLVTLEVCPHHLFFNVDDYARLGTLVQMNPSLKTVEDNRRLWEALLDGRVRVVATDHAPHLLEEKAKPYPQSPSGIPAVENSLSLMLDQVNRGRCTLRQVVDWMCTAPAEIWRIADKGKIRVGWDADLVLVDMNRVETILNENQQTRCGWTPWHGTATRGWPVRTWVMGHEVYRDGRFDLSRCGQEARFGERGRPD